jgi:hypothetical protein
MAFNVGDDEGSNTLLTVCSKHSVKSARLSSCFQTPGDRHWARMLPVQRVLPRSWYDVGEDVLNTEYPSPLSKDTRDRFFHHSDQLHQRCRPEWCFCGSAR